jgi:ABC-type polysaccharide/polyol phosphate transport system ATPase subunit
MISCSLENRVIPRLMFLYTKKVDFQSIAFDKVLSLTDKKFAEHAKYTLKDYEDFKGTLPDLHNMESDTDYGFESILKKFAKSM